LVWLIESRAGLSTAQSVRSKFWINEKEYLTCQEVNFWISEKFFPMCGIAISLSGSL
jgi:hypothetical protein